MTPQDCAELVANTLTEQLPLPGCGEVQPHDNAHIWLVGGRWRVQYSSTEDHYIVAEIRPRLPPSVHYDGGSSMMVMLLAMSVAYAVLQYYKRRRI